MPLKFMFAKCIGDWKLTGVNFVDMGMVVA